MEETKENLWLFEKVKEVSERLGFEKFEKFLSGGASDAAFPTIMGIPTLSLSFTGTAGKDVTLERDFIGQNNYAVFRLNVPQAGLKLKEIYGITDDRIAAWENNVMGYEVVTFEEDPDTLSYGIYILWATFFIHCE